MKMHRILFAILLSSSLLGGAQAQYPERPLNMVVSFPAGGSTDSIARLLANKVSESLGQTVVVQNKPGAEGQLAAQDIMRSRADGYTFGLVTSGNMSALPAMRTDPPYDVKKDFTPIADIGRYGFFLYVHESLPVHNLKEFVAYAKERPGELSYGTGNNTGVLTFAQINRVFDLDLVHIPYKGEPPATTDLIANRIQAMIGTGAGLNYAKEGKLRTLITFLPNRSPMAPDVPAFSEAGMGELPISPWAAIVGPAGMPPEAVEKLSQAFIQAANEPQIRQQIEQWGFALTPGDSDSLATLIDQQLEAHRILVKEAGIPVM